jgi:hypothetical protein
MVTVIRLGALALGVSCAALGPFGAYEFTHRLEGGVTYLVLAAPLIAVSAALIPPTPRQLGEADTRSRPSSGGPYWFRLVPWSSTPLRSGST